MKPPISFSALDIGSKHASSDGKTHDLISANLKVISKTSGLFRLSVYFMAFSQLQKLYLETDDCCETDSCGTERS
jgi:hypothetical protein